MYIYLDIYIWRCMCIYVYTCVCMCVVICGCMYIENKYNIVCFALSLWFSWHKTKQF